MAFSDLPQLSAPISLIQRSLLGGRLGHAYLVAGDDLDDLELFSQNLAKTLNCQGNAAGFPVNADACDTCLSCRKIEHLNHADVQWLRPESKSRVIAVDQVRELMQSVNLKATEARYKVIIFVSADRLNVQAANAFLKTLEEPPGNTVFLLLTTDPSRMLETIRSRCQRLFCGTAGVRFPDETTRWVDSFADHAAQPNAGLFGRYRLLDQLLQHLAAVKSDVEAATARSSPLEHYDDVDPKLLERWKDELVAATEAEYRRRRAESLQALQFWFRDVWLVVHQAFNSELAAFPDFERNTEIVAHRIDARRATRNLEVLEATQKLLFTNVQEALALEIGLLKLSL
jgi:DNA polymerase-3 subunit delta'